MKNKLILTIILLLSCAITGLYAAAPGGAGAAEAGNSTGRPQAMPRIAPGMQRSGLLGSVGSALNYAAGAARSTGGALANAYSDTLRWLAGGRPAASPTGSAAADYKPSEETARSLEDMWFLHSLIPEETAEQLAKNLSEAGIRSGAGTKDIARHLKGAGGLFTTAIREKVRRNLILSGPAVYIGLPLNKAYEGDYESFRDDLIACLNYELGTNHRVNLSLSYINLGELVRNNPDQFVDLMHAVYDTIDHNQCILTQLNLNGNGLTTLPEDAFGQFGSLRELSLNENQLTTLPAGIFAGLINLRLLLLSNNQLTTLPPGIFGGLTNLQRLRLNNNQLTTLPPGIFAGLINLQGLWLNNNKLTNLPPGIFADLINLQGLWLYENQLATLPPDIFAELSNLQLLSLHSNQLATLPADIFAGLTNLQILSLSGNKLAMLPPGIFADLTKLQKLLLDENKLIVLPNGIFADLTRLQNLWLFGNQLPSEVQEAIRQELPATTEITF